MGAIADQVVGWNPFSEGYFNNPYPHLHACRATNPVQQGRHGEWILFRHDHIKEILRAEDFDTTDLSGFFKKKEPVIFKGTNQCPYLARVTSHWPPFLNGETHERTRLLVDSALDRLDLKAILNDAINQLFTEHLTGHTLNATTLGATVPALIFNAMYGGSWDTKEGIALLQRISHSLALAEDVFLPISTYRTLNDDMQWLHETVSRDLDANAADRPLLNYLLYENNSQRLGFTRDEIASMVGIVLFASVETSQSSISTITYELLKDRKLMQRIVNADDIMINVLTEEFFRFNTPQQYTIRIPRRPITVGEKEIPAGSRLYLCLAAANRDPAVFPFPDSIISDRKSNPHLAFGSGLHTCLGSRLARTEMRLLLKPLAVALQDYEIDENEMPVWHRTIFMRGLKELKITRK